MWKEGGEVDSEQDDVVEGVEEDAGEDLDLALPGKRSVVLLKLHDGMFDVSWG